MRKLGFVLVLAVMAVFSLSADRVLKTRTVDNAHDGQATIYLIEFTRSRGGVGYFVKWHYPWPGSEDKTYFELNYVCTDLGHAYVVFDMNKYQLDEESTLAEVTTDPFLAFYYWFPNYNKVN